MKDLEIFTQHAYLTSAAVKTDSKIFESQTLAYLVTPSSKERWLNAVVRCTLPPDKFSYIYDLVKVYRDNGINFNWHLWPSSNPSLYSFLIDKLGLVFVGNGQILIKNLTHELESQIPDPSIVPLTPDVLEGFIRAKMLGWGNLPEQESDIRLAAEFLMQDKRNCTLLCLVDKKIVGAASAFVESDRAYLRGAFVIPSERGRGYYRRLILERERWLYHNGVTNLTTIADEVSSAPVYQKFQYKFDGVLKVLAQRKTPWVSL